MSRAILVGRRVRWPLAMVVFLSLTPLGCGGGEEAGPTTTGGQAVIPPGQEADNAAQEAFMESQPSQ